MKSPLRKLIEIGGPPLSSPHEIDPSYQPIPSCKTGNDLTALARAKNGFYAFESALLVRSFATRREAPHGLEAWNETSTWIETYEFKLPPAFFFAEDVFGGQFALTESGIETFDPETGEFEELCQTLDEWAELILDDYSVLTGYPLAAAWQAENRPLAPGERLVPKQLFVLGGEFETENLKATGEVRGMRARGGYASMLRDLPDGTQITFELSD